jgi:hypothetical protein
MDQEHADYADPESRRHPWTALEVAILLLIILLGLPIVAVVTCIGLLVVGGGMQDR